MIQGKRDTYFRVDEFAVMIGRAEKTVRNWAAAGRLAFVYLFGVRLHVQTDGFRRANAKSLRDDHRRVRTQA